MKATREQVAALAKEAANAAKIYIHEEGDAEFLERLVHLAQRFERDRLRAQGVIWVDDTIAKQIPQLARGQVWCRQCGKTRRVDSAEAMRNGWPKCCGCTMTIDSPEERRINGPERR